MKKLRVVVGIFGKLNLEPKRGLTLKFLYHSPSCANGRHYTCCVIYA